MQLADIPSISHAVLQPAEEFVPDLWLVFLDEFVPDLWLVFLDETAVVADELVVALVVGFAADELVVLCALLATLRCEVVL
jgi:hypothetical protein